MKVETSMHIKILLNKKNMIPNPFGLGKNGLSSQTGYPLSQGPDEEQEILSFLI